MCYSATASFVTGAALSATGGVTLLKAKTKKELPFASIPLLFGVQQIIEGGVWFSFQYGMSFLNQVATYGYVFIAYVLWPILIPFSVGLVEVDSCRRNILRGFQLLGIMISASLFYFIVRYPISSQVIHESIAYTMPTKYGILPVVLYFFATAVSCLFSSHRVINILGVLTALSLAVAYYYYTASFVSVWCFFAAVLSATAYWYFRK